jgi:signal transduction histidine kinase
MIFLAGLLGINYKLLRGSALRAAHETSQILLVNTDNQIDVIFQDIEVILQTIAHAEAVQEIDTERMRELFLANVYARNSHIRAIYLGTRDGSMHEWGVGPGFIDNTPVFPEGYDPRLRPWYKEAVEADGFALTEPYTYASVEAMGITAVRPVYADGEFIGVLGLDLIFDGLQNLVNSLHIEKGGRVMLLSKNLQILVDQFKPSYDLITEIQTFDQPQLLTAENTQREVIMDGQRYLLEHTVNEATGWTLLMFIPYEEIMAYSQQNLMIIIFLDLILMLLLGVLVTLYSRSILTAPLESIIQVLQRRERGDKYARIPSDQKAFEFKLIARLFNRLADISDETSQELETRVAKRTQEVVDLQQENTRLRIIEEKERLYGNLHDSLGARLTGINISNNVAKTALARNEIELAARMHDRIEQNTAQGIKDLKELLITNETVPFTAGDLAEYISQRIAERLSLRNISYSYTVPDAGRLELLNSELLIGVMRILQEMVTNTLKHAEALKVQLTLDIRSGELLIGYSDDGLGFEPRDIPGGSFGLKGIQQRVRYHQGEYRLTARPGRGVKYELRFRVGDTV